MCSLPEVCVRACACVRACVCVCVCRRRRGIQRGTDSRAGLGRMGHTWASGDGVRVVDFAGTQEK